MHATTKLQQKRKRAEHSTGKRQLQYAHRGRIPSHIITQRQQKLLPMEGGRALYVNPFYMSL